MEEIDTFYTDYMYAIAVCDNGAERLEWNKRRETLYNIPVLASLDSIVSHSIGLHSGCIVELRAIVGCGCKIGSATIVGTNVVVEPYCLIGDEYAFRSGTIVKSTSMISMGTDIE